MLVDSFMLAAVVRELSQFAKSALLRVQPVAPFAIALGLRGRDRRGWLVASAHPRYAHVGWQPQPPAGTTDHADTVRFAETLDRVLSHARFFGAEQVDFDRLVVLRFATVTVLGERRLFALWCEVMGKHSNLVLVDEGTGLIVDALKRLTAAQNRYREVLPGKPYQRPPTGDRRNPLTLSRDELDRIAASTAITAPRDWAQWLFGMSDPLLAVMAERVGEPLTRPDAFWRALEWLRATLAAGALTPTVWRDATGTILACYPLPLSDGRCPTNPTLTDAERVEAFGPALTQWLHTLAQREAVAQRRQSALNELRRQLAGLEQQLQELRQRWQDAQDADRYRKWGELLLTHAHAIPDGATEAVVPDYDANPPQQVRIPLPEGKTAVEAAQHYFALYRKLKNAAATLPSVIERLERRAAALRERIERLAAGDEGADLPPEKPAPSPEPPSSATAPQRDGEFLRFVVAGGYEVWVGRNAEANMRLLRLARPDDVWLHVKGAPGSHALLRVKKRGEEVPHAALEQAAQIAAYFSQRRTAAWVEVDYTRARYVRPAKGQKGLALYTHFKTLAVTPQLPSSEP